MRPVALTPLNEDSSDEELVAQLAAGQQEALGPLYSRYAPLIFNLAAQTLDRTAAEDIVQDVFLTVWRKAAMFEPERGPFRPWVLQIAHFRIVNELRRRSRRPQIEPDPEGLRLAGLADAAPAVDEEAWREYRRAAVRTAVEALPPPQRQALGLAFFEDLTHEQVASVLNLPLGTAKTRIRAGILKLRSNLAPLGVVVALATSLAFIGFRYRAELITQQRNDRALTLVTSSETQALRLTAAPGVSERTHAVYRDRAGAGIAVLTLDNFAPAPAGKTYQAWVHHDGLWISLGRAKPDTSGAARLIVERPELANPPDAVEITIEPSGGSHTPTGPLVVAWTGK